MSANSIPPNMSNQQSISSADHEAEFVGLFAAAFPHLTDGEREILVGIATTWANAGISRAAAYRKEVA